MEQFRSLLPPLHDVAKDVANERMKRERERERKRERERERERERQRKASPST